jgi:hypothetical protein
MNRAVRMIPGIIPAINNCPIEVSVKTP